jgi:hypothetical protein
MKMDFEEIPVMLPKLLKHCVSINVISMEQVNAIIEYFIKLKNGEIDDKEINEIKSFLGKKDFSDFEKFFVRLTQKSLSSKGKTMSKRNSMSEGGNKKGCNKTEKGGNKKGCNKTEKGGNKKGCNKKSCKKNRISNKIQQQNIVLPYSSSDSNIPNADVLSPFRSIQQQSVLSGSYTKNINYVEIAFSPQNEINDDINEQLGYFNIGEYIGDPRLQSTTAESYPALDDLRDAYFAKYSSNYQWFDYIRLIEFFDNSLFKMLQDFIPARSDLAAGIVVKQHVLERNKYPVPQVTLTASLANITSGSTNIPYVVQDQTITASILVGHITGSNGGTMPDLFGQTQSFNYFLNITQSWSGSNLTPSGYVGYIHDSQDEFFNGELSGSVLTVTTGSLSDCNVVLHQIYTTSSINGPFTGITFYYFPDYDFETDKTYYLTKHYNYFISKEIKTLLSIVT